MRRGLSLILALVAAAPAEAQVGHAMGEVTTVEALWQAFETACAEAITDPHGFASRHPRTGTLGGPLAVASDDGKVAVFYSDPADPNFRQIEFLALPGGTELVCDAHAMLSHDAYTNPNAPTGEAENERRLRALVAARPGSSIGGGTMPSNAMSLAAIGVPIEGLTMEERIFSIETPLAGAPRFVYAGLMGGGLNLIAHVQLPPDAMPRLESASGMAGAAPAPAPARQPAASDAFAEAVRANMALAIELCLRNIPLVDQARAAFAQAGFTHTIEDFGGNERIHWYGAPANTVNVAITEGQMSPECRVTTNHMGVTEPVGFAGAVAQARFPAMNYAYGSMENTPPVTAQNMGNRWEFCTGWIGWNGQHPSYISVANAGNDPACVEDGSSQIVIGK